MNLLSEFDNPHLVALGVTLYHLIWQGAVVGALTALLLRCLRSATPQYRYVAAYGALMLILGLGAATFAWFAPDRIAAPRAEQSVEIAPLQPLVLTARPVRTLPPRAEVFATMALPPAKDPSESHRLLSVMDRYLYLGAPLAALGWGIGAAFMALRLAFNLTLLEILRRRGHIPPDPATLHLLERLRARIGVRRAVSLLQSTQVAVPCVLGVFRPLILLPVSVCCGLTPTQLEAILSHELAHIRRHDFLMNLLQSIACGLLYFHPAVWWLNRRITLERELCCDDLVTRNTDARTYADALARVAELSQRGPRLATAATDGELMTRIRRLLALPAHQQRPAGLAASAFILAFVVALCFAALPGAMSQAEAQQEAERSTTTRQAAAPPPERRLTFPSGHDLGTVSIRPWNAPYDSGWESERAASGTITIPAGYEAALHVSETGASDLSALAQLPADGLQGIYLARTTVTDAQMVHIQHMNSLRVVNLAKTHIGDETLGYLQNSSGTLEMLDVWRSSVTDAGVAHLQGATALRHLSLNQTGVTDDGLALIGNMTELEYLDLWRTAITDEGIAHLAGLEQMRMLGIEDTGITDEALQYLSDMTELEELVLERTAITDAGIRALLGLEKLQRLHLDDTFVTDAGVELLGQLSALHFLSLPLTISPEMRERLAALGIPMERGAPGAAGKRTIHVVDGVAGQPIPGASVELQVGGADYRLVSTAADGSVVFYLPGSARNPLGILVDAEGFATAQTSWDTESATETTIALTRSVAIGGRVTNGRGAALSGVEVLLPIVGERQWGIQAGAVAAASLRTDASGKWAIHGVPEGLEEIEITLRHPEYSTTVYPAGKAPMGQLKALAATLVMEDPVSLSGRVVDNAGNALDNISVRIVNRGAVQSVQSVNLPTSGANGESAEPDPVALGMTPGASLALNGPDAVLESAVTDKSGRFKIEKCSVGALWLEVNAPGFVPYAREVTISESKADLRITLERSAPLRVRVVDAEKRPLENAMVSFQSEQAPHASAHARTDSNGRAVWNQAPEKAVRAFVRLDQYVALSEVLKPSDKEITLTLAKAHPNTIRVVNAVTGIPLTNFSVWVAGIAAPALAFSEAYWMEHRLQPNEGRVQLEDLDRSLPLGNGRAIPLMVTAPGYAPSPMVDYKPSAPMSVSEFKLRPLPALGGRVALPDGRPAAKVRIVAIDPNWPVVVRGTHRDFPNVEAQSTTTSKAGDFNTNAAPGYRLFAHGETGYAEWTVPDEGGEAPVLTLQPWARIKVESTSDSTRAQRLHTRTSGSLWTWVASMPGDADGPLIGQIPSGTTEVIVLSRAPALPSPQLEIVTVAPGPGETSTIAATEEGGSLEVSLKTRGDQTRGDELFLCLASSHEPEGAPKRFYATPLRGEGPPRLVDLAPGTYELSLRATPYAFRHQEPEISWTHPEPIVITAKEESLNLGELAASR